MQDSFPGTASLRRRLRAILAALGLAASLVLPAAAAQAHDVLEATNPANGATVQSVPASVALTFDHTPIGVGTEVLVKDPTGTNQSDGAARIVDNTVTQDLRPGAPAGAYTVVWRVVSSDSHPIEGTFTFTATAPRTGTAPAGSGGQPPAAAATPSAAPAPTATAGTGWLVWALVGAAALAAVAALAFFVRRTIGRAPEE